MIYLVLKGLGLGLGLFGGLIGYLRYEKLWVNLRETADNGFHFLICHRYKSSKKWGYYKLDKDLEGRVIVLTGASEGLGFEVSDQTVV